MKKKEIKKKLQLSRETLLNLKDPELQKAVGAEEVPRFSTLSYCPGSC